MVLKKYRFLGTVPSGKNPKSEPYRAVPCSGKAPYDIPDMTLGCFSYYPTVRMCAEREMRTQVQEKMGI